MKAILEEALRVLASGERVALSTIVASSGSLPMSRRSKMLVRSDGTLMGTVGGGCLESEVYERARSVLSGPEGRSLDRFVLTETQAGAEGLNCGGSVQIFTEALAPGPVTSVLGSCVESLERREEGVLATVLVGAAARSGGKALITKEGIRSGSLGSERLDRAAGAIAGELLGSNATRLADVDGGVRVFLETVSPAPELIALGGGHVAASLARIAKAAGFIVIVVDDRPEFANAKRHPDADETLVIPFDQVFSRLSVDAGTYLVAVTRGHQHDETVIRGALRKPAAYIGMIGSGRKVALLRKKLAAEGYTRKELDRLHAPVGLQIGADGPGEIAVSIVAELIAVRRLGGHAGSMSLSGKLKI